MRKLMVTALLAPLGFLLGVGCSSAEDSPGRSTAPVSGEVSEGEEASTSSPPPSDGGNGECHEHCDEGPGPVCNVVEIAERLCDGTGLLDETCEDLAETLCGSGHGGREDMCLLGDLGDIICGCDDKLTEPLCDLLGKKLCLDDILCDVEALTSELVEKSNLPIDVCRDVAIGLCNEHGDKDFCELPDLGEIICNCNDRGLTGDVCDLLAIDLCDIDETVCDVGKISEDVCDAVDGLSVLKCNEIARGLCRKIDIEIGDKCLIDVEAELCDNGVLDTVLEGSLGQLVGNILDVGHKDQLCKDLAVDICLL